MWFKSDISIYQKDDFRYYLKKCPCLGTVWEWLQRTSVIEESGTFNLTLPLKGMFCEDYQITETNFNNALEHLASLNLINFDNNSITIFGWENNQGAYLVQKEYKKNWIAEKRQKKSKEENVESMSNRQTIDSDSTKYPVDVLDKIRGEEIREEKNREEENKKEENILNTFSPVEEKTILSSKLDGEINKPISTFSTSKEIQSTSKEIQYLPPKQEKTPYSAEFEEFWAVYNKKEGSKAEAFKKFKQALKEVELPRLIEKVKAYNRSKRVQDGYKCDPVTWLNQRRWESDYTPTTFLNAQELNECWDSLPLERQKNIEAVRWLMS